MDYYSEYIKITSINKLKNLRLVTDFKEMAKDSKYFPKMNVQYLKSLPH